MMNAFNLTELVRENIKSLKPYSSARMEYTATSAILLDANENPFGMPYNRYPDPLQLRVKEVIGKIKQVDVSQLFIGNGSDEIIDLLIRLFCEPQGDAIITLTPSYTMYITSAEINNVDVIEIELDEAFSLPLTKIESAISPKTKLLFLCTPNNPIGNTIPLDQIEIICKKFNGIVVVDEAYIDFSDSISATTLLDKFKNIFILQTLSKAYGMAGLRLGIGIGNPQIIALLNRIKPPYNVSQIVQEEVVKRLQFRAEIDAHIALIKKERERLFSYLKSNELFYKVYPSEGNFILVQSERYLDLYDYLCAKGIVIRVRNILPKLPNGLRITVGLPEENSLLIDYLENFKNRL